MGFYQERRGSGCDRAKISVKKEGRQLVNINGFWEKGVYTSYKPRQVAEVCLLDLDAEESVVTDETGRLF